MRHPRQKSPKHLEFIRSLPCIVCREKTQTEEAAHIRFGWAPLGKRPTGKGEKPDDKWTVPLCGAHHRKQHKIGEAQFWGGGGKFSIWILPKALALWAASGDYELGEQIVRER